MRHHRRNRIHVESLEQRVFLSVSPAFDAPLEFSSPAGVNGVAVGDLNGDGKSDVVTGSAGILSVFLGDGTGQLGPRRDIVAGGDANTVAIADFNADTYLDLVTSIAGVGRVGVYLNDGVGNFALHGTFATGDAVPRQIALGDFDGSGTIDLAVVNSASPTINRISVLLGDGAGNFGALNEYGSGQYLTGIITADFNDDGDLDLASVDAMEHAVGILYGNGDGTFDAVVQFSIAGEPFQLVADDFNEDGKVDIATANYSVPSVSVLLNDGTGAFTPRTDFPVGPLSSGIATGDFNADGHVDLVTANWGSTTLSVLAGNGAGDFAPQVQFLSGNAPRIVAVSDFNGDGAPDLVATNNHGGSVSILLNLLTPEPPPPTTISDVIGDVSDLLTSGSLSVGQVNSLISKLEIAEAKLEAGSLTPAAKVLNAFLNELRAMVESGTLTEVEALPLIEQIELILEEFGV